MMTIEVGGIYRAVPVGGDAHAALVLVSDIESGRRRVQVTLLSPDTELGTDSDLLLAGHTFGRQYDLLIESDVFGSVDANQLDRKIGQVDAQTLEDRRTCGR